MLPANIAKAVATATKMKDANSKLNSFFRWVENRSRSGDFSGRFYTENRGEHLSDEDLNIIRSLGYGIEWNSPCLWYEVRWD